MLLANTSEFYCNLQTYIYVHPDLDGATLEEVTEDGRFILSDVQELTTVGNPIGEEDEEYSLWGLLNPGESFVVGFF